MSGLVFLAWMYHSLVAVSYSGSQTSVMSVVPGRAYFCRSAGDKGMFNVDRSGGKSERGTKKELVSPWVHTKRWNLQGMEVGGRRGKTSSILVQ